MSDQPAELSALSRSKTLDADRIEVAGAVPVPGMQWRTRILLPATILMSTVVLIGFAARDIIWSATPVRVVPVVIKSDVASAAVGTIVVQAPGWVEADPFAVAVSALAGGVVDDVLVLEGEKVEAGQVVAELIADEAKIAYDGAEATLAERRAALLAARARLDEAQRNWDHPIELTRTLQTTEARLDETRAILDRWPAELARDQAHVIYLEAEHDRIKPLIDKGQATDIELIQARQALETQRATVEVTRRREPILRARVRVLEAEVRAAREDLELRIADTRALAEARAAVQRAEADIASVQADLADAALRLDRMEIRSPVSGIVMTRLAEPGSKLMLNMDSPSSAHVVRVYDPDSLQVRVDVPLVDAAQVGVGQTAEVIVDVLPDRVFPGQVTRIVHEADVQKNTLQVKVAIGNPTPELKPEMLARARFFAMTERHNAADAARTMQRLFIPESSVVNRNGATFVWLADQVDHVARLRPVALGRAKQDDWIAVTEGLQPGDRVISSAPDDLVEGQRIRILEE